MAAEAHLQRAPNRLIREKSPYLLQHAHNPVDWYPWGAEAFERAKAEDKPIFLSIGYSTCHWCHVMERESFENEEIARMLSEQFVPVKVDREERPDLDQVYMTAVTALSGSGGWPMTVFLTPEGKPFYGGTYYPPESRWGRPGMRELLPAIAKAWREDRQRLMESAEQLTVYLQQARAAGASETPLTAAVFDAAYRQYASQFDEVRGGFGEAPKFPRPHTLLFLLRYWDRSGEAQALAMAEATLERMASGGIHDHLGGGFHRYSVDAEWLVPHFEKMLYDQALLSRAYVEAFQATGKTAYADVARGICEYVLRDLADASGAFYAAEDADSEGVEGKFYVWTPQEIEVVLGVEEAELFCAFYGVRPGGNFAFEGASVPGGVSIAHVEQPLEAFAALRQLNPAGLAQRLKADRERLLAVRSRRVRPHRDDKVLTDWNGLMISAMAFGGAALDEPRYIRAAEAAATFILSKMQLNGRLLHRYRDGEAAIDAFLDDYACFIGGLLDLYEATGNPKWLREAVRLADLMLAEFWDTENGGLFLRSLRLEPLVARTKELYDGAVPSGNSMAALGLVRLAKMTGERRFEEKAGAIFRVFGEDVGRLPMAYPYLLCALDLALGPSREIVLAGEASDPDTGALHRLVYRRFLPRRVLLLHPPSGETAEAVESLAPWLKDQRPLNGRATAYVCQDYACHQPTTDPRELERLLELR